MESSTKPEILKMHLGMAVLQLLSLGVADIEQFDFVESPPPNALKKALESLKLLGALDVGGALNRLGEEMLELPTEPRLSKALLEGLERGCGDDVIIAAALMSSGHDVFYRGNIEKRNECAIQKQEFCQTSGDLLSAVEVYKKWMAKSPKAQAAWCKENALNSKSLRLARETGNEIRGALRKLRPGLNLVVTSENVQESVSKSMLAGYFENIAWSFGHEKLGYKVLSCDQKARIHPSSVLSSLGDQPEWVLYQQVRSSSDQVFLLNITPINVEWLAEVAMHMLQYLDEDEVARSRVVRKRIQVGPGLVIAVIGSKGSTIKQIEKSVADYSGHSDFCAVECNVDKGIVDVYATAQCLHYASELVGDVIEAKRRELQGYSEVVISNVGDLKTLVANDLRTTVIVEAGRSCKFNVFIDKEDVSAKVDSNEVLETLTFAGNMIHHHAATMTKDERNFRWGTITYANPSEAEKAKSYLQSGDLDQWELPENVERIQLRPSYYERVTNPNDAQSSDVRVLISWFPLPASGRAYIKCKSQDVAEEIVHELNCHVTGTVLSKPKAFLQKKSGDVAINVDETDYEFTVRKQLDHYCTALEIAKITVPSVNENVNLEVEKKDLMEIMKSCGGKRVLNKPWMANCKKVMACVLFDDLRTAKKVISMLNSKMDVLGVRAMYMELDRKREVTCDARLYEKVKKTVDEMRRKNEGVIEIENEKRQRRMKITVTGDNAEDVQTIGASLADLVSPEIILIEDAAVARLCSSGYGRGKVKQIEKNNGAIIQTSNFGRRIQITAGRSEAKLKARAQIEKLIEELQKTRHSEVDLRSSDRPVGAIREILKHFGKDLRNLVEGEDCKAKMEIRRRKLVLEGATEAVGKVQTKVEEFLRTLPNARRETNVDHECPVCFGEIEEPYLLKLCGHAYCSDPCIAQYLTNVFESVKSADLFPLKCMHDGCEFPVIKEDYASFLSTEQVEKLYQVSLECFLIGNESFKPCPTADCSWVYETTSSPSVFTCPECGIQSCKSCGDSAHELYDTCEAFKVSKDPSQSDRLYEEWATGADTRKCPNCSVLIEKNKGCSHVQCTRCKAHICWNCGKKFETSTKCYTHIESCGKK